MHAVGFGMSGLGGLAWRPATVFLLHCDCWALRQAGLNMIRLWGGAAVARDAFYDACDEAGILVRRVSDQTCAFEAIQVGVLGVARHICIWGHVMGAWLPCFL